MPVLAKGAQGGTSNTSSGLYRSFQKVSNLEVDSLQVDELKFADGSSQSAAAILGSEASGLYAAANHNHDNHYHPNITSSSRLNPELIDAGANVHISATELGHLDGINENITLFW